MCFLARGKGSCSVATGERDAAILFPHKVGRRSLYSRARGTPLTVFLGEEEAEDRVLLRRG